MEPAFWHERWEKKEIGFHEERANELLIRHFPRLSLPDRSTVFVPLCGKSLDLNWLLEQGNRVVGVELSEDAVGEAFENMQFAPSVEKIGELKKFSSGDITIYAGDFFTLTPDLIGSVDAIYDRAALVALPPGMRKDYTRHLVSLTTAVPQLLISFDYDQSQTEGPPFSVPLAEIQQHYSSHYEENLLERRSITGQLAKRCAGEEIVVLLKKPQR